MKLAHLPILLGLKRPKPRLYEQSTVVVDLAQDGPIDFAVWHHPNERASFPSQPEIDELRTFIRPGDFCIDIGAQTGDTAVPIALACGPTGACLALEPNPYCFPVLEANARLNRSRLNIIPLRYAVGEREETMTFNYSDPGYCNGGVMPDIARWRHGHLFPLDVEARRLESVLAGYGDRAERLRYIKIDAEGYDLNILRSIRAILERRRPFLRVEVYRHLDLEPRHAMWEFLTGLGYRVWRADDPAHLRGSVIGREGMVEKKGFDLFAEPA